MLKKDILNHIKKELNSINYQYKRVDLHKIINRQNRQKIEKITFENIDKEIPLLNNNIEVGIFKDFKETNNTVVGKLYSNSIVNIYKNKNNTYSILQSQPFKKQVDGFFVSNIILNKKDFVNLSKIDTNNFETMSIKNHLLEKCYEKSFATDKNKSFIGNFIVLNEQKQKEFVKVDKIELSDSNILVATYINKHVSFIASREKHCDVVTILPDHFVYHSKVIKEKGIYFYNEIIKTLKNELINFDLAFEEIWSENKITTNYFNIKRTITNFEIPTNINFATGKNVTSSDKVVLFLYVLDQERNTGKDFYSKLNHLEKGYVSFVDVAIKLNRFPNTLERKITEQEQYDIINLVSSHLKTSRENIVYKIKNDFDISQKERLIREYKKENDFYTKNVLNSIKFTGDEL